MLDPLLFYVLPESVLILMLCGAEHLIFAEIKLFLCRGLVQTSTRLLGSCMDMQDGVLLVGWSGMRSYGKEYITASLIREFLMIAVFRMLDPLLFYVLPESVLIPMLCGAEHLIFDGIKLFLCRGLVQTSTRLLGSCMDMQEGVLLGVCRGCVCSREWIPRQVSLGMWTHLREFRDNRPGLIVKEKSHPTTAGGLLSLSSLGSSCFIGEFLILVGAFQRNSLVATLAALGMILGVTYSLWLYNGVVSGNLKPDFLYKFSDLNGREVFIFIHFLVGVVWMGVYPKVFPDCMHTSPIYTLQLPPFELVKQALNMDGDSPAPSIAIPALDVGSLHSQMGISEKPLYRVNSLLPVTKSASISSS
nr:NADH dehydrogenase subunit 4, mitochondrial [Tanacetum cinerariifolium]